MESILWVASMFISNLVATCTNWCCMLTSALCVGVCSCWKSSQEVVMWEARGSKLVGEKLLVWCWVVAGAGTSAVGLFWMPSVKCFDSVKLSKLKDHEVVCYAPLAHQGRLQRIVWFQVKEQAWCVGQLQQRAQRA